jgi:hypothetical protein
MAASRKLTSKVHQLVTAMITRYYINAAEELGIKNPQTGGVTFVQRFGSALNLNVHLHIIAIDGVFSTSGPIPVYFQLRGPSDDEVADIVAAVAHSVIETLRNDNYLPEEGLEIDPPTWLDQAFAESEQLAAAAAASTTMYIAFGDRAGQKVRRIGRGFGYEEEIPAAKGKRCYSVNGFTIHANRYIGPKERGKLEELLAYGARGAFANDRLSLCDPEKPDGDLVYSLKRPWSDGTEGIVMSAAETIEKLVALIPPPYVHLSRYFGVLSSRSKWRRQIVLRPEIKKGFVASADGQSSERLTWSKLLARVFKIDVTRCLACGARLQPSNCDVVTNVALIEATLKVLGLAFEPLQRGPPRRAFFDPNIDQSSPYAD